jgi:hypothetical protein
VTEAVLTAMAGAKDARFKEIMTEEAQDMRTARATGSVLDEVLATRRGAARHR